MQSHLFVLKLTADAVFGSQPQLACWSAAAGVNGLPLKATGTVLDHRLCSQQSVYDARVSSRIKVRIHYIRDWVVDYSQPVTVWLITDWAWYRSALLPCCQLAIHKPMESDNHLHS